MKSFIIGLLLLGTAPMFAQDSLSYEVFPECFFHVDHKSTLNFNEGVERDVWIDTCNKSDILEPDYYEWPKPVNDLVSLDFVASNVDTLIAENAIYSNQYTYIKLGGKSGNDNIVLSRSEYIEMKEITESDIKNEYQALYLNLKEKLDSIGENTIYAYGYIKTAKDSYAPRLISVQFQLFLSFKYIKNIIESVGLNIYDPIVNPQVSVIEKQEQDVQIIDNMIILTDIKKSTNYSVYDVRGSKLLNGKLELGANNTIDISTLNIGIYFLQIDDRIIKFIKGEY